MSPTRIQYAILVVENTLIPIADVHSACLGLIGFGGLVATLADWWQARMAWAVVLCILALGVGCGTVGYAAARHLWMRAGRPRQVEVPYWAPARRWGAVVRFWRTHDLRLRYPPQILAEGNAEEMQACHWHAQMLMMWFSGGLIAVWLVVILGGVIAELTDEPAFAYAALLGAGAAGPGFGWGWRFEYGYDGRAGVQVEDERNSVDH